MRYLSVCSGVEAASVAWHPLGWEPVGFSEIESFPAAVLAERFPTVPNFGDLTKHETWPIASGSIELLVGGTPCQAFSVAGKRAGLDDPRGQLMLAYLDLAGRLRPRWIVWENVPGVLSSNGGRDFGAFLGGLEQLGYGWAYRVLDAQWVRTQRHPRAVPQRRRRVFVVGCLGDAASAAAVLFERESVQRNPAKGAKARQVPAADARSGAEGGSGKWPAEVTCTLNTMYATKLGLEDQHALHGAPAFVPGAKSPVIWREFDQANAAHCEDFAGTLNCDKGQQGGIIAQPIVIDRAAFNQGQNAAYTAQIGPADVMPSLVAKGPHALAYPLQDGRELDKRQNGLGIGDASDPAYTVDCTGAQAVAHAIAFKPGQSADARSLGESDEVACTLEAGGGGNNRQAVALAGVSQQPVAHAFQLAGDRSNPTVSVSDIAFCLPANPMSDRAQAVATQAIAFEPGIATREGGDSRFSVEVSPTLRSNAGDNQPAVATQQPVPFDLFQITAPLNRQSRSPGDPCHTLAVSNAAFAAIVIPETHTIAFTQNQREEVRLLDNVAGAIAAEPGTHQSTYLLQPTVTTYERHDQDGKMREVKVEPTLPSTADNGCELPLVMQAAQQLEQPIAFHPTQDPISSVGVSHALGTGSTEGAATCAIAFSAKDYGADAGNIAPTLRAGGHTTSHANGGVMPAVATSLAVRRLTPRECERLQGFPDDWTAIVYRGKPAADGPRYKAMGNSMAVNCMAWIGERIAAVNARLSAKP